MAVLAMTGGALLYVIKELFAGARKESHQVAIMASVVLGFVLAWATNFIVNMGATSA